MSECREALERALTRLKAGADAEAIVLLRDAWRHCRAPDLASAITRLHERLPPVRVPGAARTAAREERWCALAIAAEPSEVGWFASRIDCVERLEALLPHAPDPRLSGQVGAILSDLRPAFGNAPNATRDLWWRAAEVVDVLDDPALLALVDAEAPRNSEWNVGGLTMRLDAALVGLAKRHPDGVGELDEAERAALDQIQELLVDPRQERDATRDEELRNAVYAEPKADGPRAVYADWLLERGDARGELIGLQLMPSTPEGDARAEELVRRARRHFVGPLAPALRAVSFRRGFPACAHVHWAHRGDLRRLGSHPAWATLEELTFPNERTPTGMPQHLDSRVTTALRRLAGVTTSGLETLCQAPEPWTVRALSAQVATTSGMAAMSSTEKLPELTELTLLGAGSASTLAWVWKAKLAQTLETLRLVVAGRRNLWTMQQRASQLPDLTALHIEVSPLTLELSRGPEHRFTHAVVGTQRGNRSAVESLIELLEMAPEYAFTHLHVRMPLSSAQLRRFDDAAARQRGLDDIVMDGDFPT